MEKWIIYAIVMTSVFLLIRKTLRFMKGKDTVSCCGSARTCNSFCGCGKESCKTE